MPSDFVRFSGYETPPVGVGPYPTLGRAPLIGAMEISQHQKACLNLATALERTFDVATALSHTGSGAEIETLAARLLLLVQPPRVRPSIFCLLRLLPGKLRHKAHMRVARARLRARTEQDASDLNGFSQTSRSTDLRDDILRAMAERDGRDK